MRRVLELRWEFWVELGFRGSVLVFWVCIALVGMRG